MTLLVATELSPSIVSETKQLIVELDEGPVFMDAVNVVLERVGSLGLTLLTFPPLMDH